MLRTSQEFAVLHALNCLPGHFVGPGAWLTCWLVAAVEIHHELVFGSLSEQCLIQVYDLFGLVVEKVQLNASDAKFMTLCEESAACFGIAKFLTVFPDLELI